MLFENGLTSDQTLINLASDPDPNFLAIEDYLLKSMNATNNLYSFSKLWWNEIYITVRTRFGPSSVFKIADQIPNCLTITPIMLKSMNATNNFGGK